jgi:hypothetical protein
MASTILARANRMMKDNLQTHSEQRMSACCVGGM